MRRIAPAAREGRNLEVHNASLHQLLSAHLIRSLDCSAVSLLALSLSHSLAPATSLSLSLSLSSFADGAESLSFAFFSSGLLFAPSPLYPIIRYGDQIHSNGE